MNTVQTKLLVALARKLKKKEKSKVSAIQSLNSAGIVNAQGKVVSTFPNLKRILSVSE